ncbi:PKD domain-containing protein [Oceanicoccus sagamiensis]|uniref:DUF4214 domain-containing protein n=1 Tax=Oceanicoccus sagamiensis TaxID=716816 RepID=A0A1X9NMG1_9GAMM|nr:DUF4214 domain-containing protein [Oceanicoccus sagamiensis]ARN75987.1 hypothetical protein BST96_18940 [Oceanicoccus sagamiensis]
MLKLPSFFFALSFFSALASAEIVATKEDTKALARLYSAAFDRQPDLGGLNFWVNSFQQGRTIESIAGDFNRSFEFSSKYGDLDNLAFIRQLYRNVLGRGGEPGGVAFWQSHLDEGRMTRSGVLEDFADSTENRRKTDPVFNSLMQRGDAKWDFDMDGDGVSDKEDALPFNPDYSTIPPVVADAGQDQTVTEGQAITLSPAGSGGIIAHTLWEQVLGPVVDWMYGLNGSINFNAPSISRDTELGFLLTVTDEYDSSSTDTVNIFVEPILEPLTVDAGSDRGVIANKPVLLQGQASSPNAELAEVLWQQLSGPTVTIEQADSLSASFIAPSVIASDLVFQLSVTDEKGVGGVATLTLTQAFEELVVDAGIDREVIAEGQVSLLGQVISPNGELAQVQWRQLSGFAVTLEQANSLSASFTVPRLVESELVFELSVTDDKGVIGLDTVTLSQAFLKNTALTGRVSLEGAVTGSVVSVYDLENFSAGVLCQVSSSASEREATSGWLELPADCIEADKQYLLIARDGIDLLSDPSEWAWVDGRIRAIIDGAQLIAGEWNISMLTEACYQYVNYDVLSGQTYQHLKERMTECSRYLLKDDITGDSEINIEDLWAWSSFDNPEARFTKFLYYQADPQNLQLDDEWGYRNLTTGVSSERTSLFASLLLTTDINDSWGFVDAQTSAYDDQYAYMGSNSLRVLDLDNGNILSSTPVEFSAIAVSGSYAYVGNRDTDSADYGFNVIDISDVTNPVLVGAIALPNSPGGDREHPRSIQIVGDVAYVLSSRVESVYSIDISDPEDPLLLDSIITPLNTANTIVAGQNVLAVVAWDKVVLIDTSTPADIAVISTVFSSGSSNSIGAALIDGDILYLATDLGLNVVDISVPASPLTVSTFNETGRIYTLSINDNKLYGNLGHSLVEFDTSDHDAIDIAAQYYSSAANTAEFIVRNQRAFYERNEGLVVSDLNTLHKPQWSEQSIVSSNSPYLAVNDQWLVAVGHEGISTFDTATESLNSEEDNSCFHLRVIAIKGNRLFILCDDSDIHFSIRELVADDVSQQIGEITLSDSGSAYDFVIEDDIVVMVGAKSPAAVLTLLDISADTPDRLSIFEIEDDFFKSVAVQANTAYIVGSNQGKLYAVDISNPLSPSLVSSVDIKGATITLEGDYLYVAQDFGGRSNGPLLEVVNISDPAAMTVVGRLELAKSVYYGPKMYDASYGVETLLKEGDYIYAGTPGVLGTQVINVADPAKPYLVGGGSKGGGRPVAIHNNFIYYFDSNGIAKLPLISQEAP